MHSITKSSGIVLLLTAATALFAGPGCAVQADDQPNADDEAALGADSTSEEVATTGDEDADTKAAPTEDVGSSEDAIRLGLWGGFPFGGAFATPFAGMYPYSAVTAYPYGGLAPYGAITTYPYGALGYPYAGVYPYGSYAVGLPGGYAGYYGAPGVLGSYGTYGYTTGLGWPFF